MLRIWVGAESPIVVSSTQYTCCVDSISVLQLHDQGITIEVELEPQETFYSLIVLPTIQTSHLHVWTSLVCHYPYHIHHLPPLQSSWYSSQWTHDGQLSPFLIIASLEDKYDTLEYSQVKCYNGISVRLRNILHEHNKYQQSSSHIISWTNNKPSLKTISLIL